MLFHLPTRRRAALAAALAAGCVLAARAPRTDEVRLGSDRHTYVWSKEWSATTEQTRLGNTHGCVLVDSSGRVLVNTDGEDAVVIFSPQGEKLSAFGSEFAGGLHGMQLRVEEGSEVLYAVHTGRSEALKLSLSGEVL